MATYVYDQRSEEIFVAELLGGNNSIECADHLLAVRYRINLEAGQRVEYLNSLLCCDLVALNDLYMEEESGSRLL
jgi:hypothetical protein